MRFLVDHDRFTAAVAWAARGVPHRPPSPVLAGILVEVGDGTVSLSGFDHEVHTRMHAPATGTAPGRALVGGRFLAEVARTLPDGPVHVHAEGTTATLRCGPVRFGMPLMPVEDYPGGPPAAPAVGALAGDDLASAVAQVAVAAGHDDALPMLTGVRLDAPGDRLTLVATDRYRLACRSIPWNPRAALPPVVLPARVLAATARAAAGVPEVVLTRSGAGDGGDWFGIVAAEREAAVRPLATAFPKFESLWPTGFAAHVDVATEALVTTLGRVSLAAGPRAAVTLHLRAGSARVTARGADERDADEELDVVLSGDPIEVTLNPSYLLDGLRQVATATARVSFVGPGKPVVVRPTTGPDAPEDTTGYRYLTMSLRPT